MPNPKQPLTFDHPQIAIQLPAGATGNVSVPCPRCSKERKHKHAKCLYVEVTEGTWVCMHCHRTGSLTRGWVDAPVDRDDDYQPRQRQYSKPKPVPPVTDWQKLVSWAKDKRGISEEVLNRNRVTTGVTWCATCEEEKQQILFPYYRAGEHINTKHRCGLKHFRMEKNAERIMYGYDDVVLPNGAMPEQVIVVEGEMDKLAMEMAGFTSVLSVPDGAPAAGSKNYDSKFKFLDDDGLQRVFGGGCKDVVIAVDADAAGERLQQEFIRRFMPEYCRVVTWPTGIKDANDYLLATGPDGLREIVEAAEPVPIEGVIEPWMLTSETDRYYREGLPRGVSLGWPGMDRMMTMMPGALIILQAIPTSGKSSWMNAVLLNLAQQHGWGFAVCSPEWQPPALHQIAFLETITNRPFEGPGRMTYTEKTNAEAWLNTVGTFIAPERKSVDEIIRAVRAIIYRRGIRVLVIDPFTELEYQTNGDKLKAIGDELSKLKAFGQKHKVAIVLVVHPPKPQRRVTKDGSVEYDLLGIYGAAHSADFANKADYIIELKRESLDPGNTAVSIYVEKVRFKFAGEPGMLTLYFDKPTGRYYEERQFAPIPPETMG